MLRRTRGVKGNYVAYAKRAQEAGACALLIVNTLNVSSPLFNIQPGASPEKAAKIAIPVVLCSAESKKCSGGVAALLLGGGGPGEGRGQIRVSLRVASLNGTQTVAKVSSYHTRGRPYYRVRPHHTTPHHT